MTNRDSGTDSLNRGEQDLTLSVVSHGHSECLQVLLDELSAQGPSNLRHLIVTHNLPGHGLTVSPNWPFQVSEIRNAEPRGFGANHNQAFQHCSTPFFGVMNPDLDHLPDNLWARLVELAAPPHAGLAYPVLLNLDGTVQDSEREVPTPLSLLKRYTHRPPVPRRDWANAACWVLRREVWQQLGGFDEGYFLYCEDVDFCLRVQLAGLELKRADVRMTHHAQRTSHRQWRYVSLHLRSLWRLWTTPTLYRYLWRLRKTGPVRLPDMGR